MYRTRSKVARSGNMSGVRRIVGTRSKSLFLAPLPAGAIEWSAPDSAAIEIARDDQIVTVGAGVTIEELQSALGHVGLCLPLPNQGEVGSLLAGLPGTVGGLIAANMPHGLSSQFGGAREWLLQIETEFQGRVARSGARVVKSVAGFDVHKTYVGSRGLLGPILGATLRAWPVAAVPKSAGRVVGDWGGEDVWIVRTLPSDFPSALEGAQNLFAYDQASCTLWQGAKPSPLSEGWIVGPRGEMWSDNPDTRFAQRIKDVFDPTGQWI